MGVAAPRWERRYSLKLLSTDFVIVFMSVFGAAYLRFGISSEELQIPLTERTRFAIDYTLLSAILCLVWLFALHLFDTRDEKIFGTGPSEYKRIINATLTSFGLFAIVAFTFQMQIGRGYLMIALPTGLFLLLATRWMWRKRLHRQRGRGLNTYRTLIVGERNKILHVAENIRRDAYVGFDLLGAVTEHGSNHELLPNIPVIAGYAGLLGAVDSEQADTVIITGADTITPEELRRIGWELETRRVDLIVAPSLTDIAGPRIHARPVSGLPLIHVEYPRFTGRKYFMKRFSDLVLSSALLVLLSPILLVLALIVKFGSKGPIIFRQRRVGLQGREFNMLKFRSMVVDAEDQLPGLLDRTEGNGVLFKMKNDPRITRAGRWMRKYSMDELPQLVNVFKGDMSLIGPRPPLPREVETYEEWVHRRLLVKPGITGLWQVSGRSELSWEDSIRLDLYYVENWSMTGDLLILWKTVRTVLRPEGAY